MRAVMLHGPGDLRVEEVSDPRPGPGEVVVAVTAALTCATDAKMAAAGAHPALGPLPAPLGHEVAGVVAALGSGVAGVREGDAVVVANSAPCGACPRCAEGRPNLCRAITYVTGAFAERMLVPAPIVARNLHPLPPGLAPALAAAAEPLACAVHTALGCATAAPREAVVLGGGVQGRLLSALLARSGDRVTLVDPHPGRRDGALRAGAAAAADVPGDDAGLCDLRGRLGDGDGADLVVEAVGRPAAWRMALALARPGGEVVLHGGCPAGARVELPTGPLHYQELTVRGSYHHTPGAFARALELIAADAVPVRELIEEPIGLDGVPWALTESRGHKHPVSP